MDYLEINRRAFDATADEHKAKIGHYAQWTQDVVARFGSHIDDRFAHPHILELGPGSGYAAKLLRERGYHVTAIEFSEKMAAVARETAPGIDIIVDEFLQHDFSATKYSGIYAVAFIHLFPNEDVRKVLAKINFLLDDQGVACIATTLHQTAEEGYFAREHFSNQLVRYRRRFTKEELEQLLHAADFQVIGEYPQQDSEIEGLLWVNYMVERE